MYSHVSLQVLSLGERLPTACAFQVDSSSLMCRGAGEDAMLGALAKEQEGSVRDLLYIALAGRSGEEVIFCQPRNWRIVFAELWARLNG